MNKRYRLAEIEEAVSEMEELIDIEDDIAEINDDFQIVVSGWSVYVESLNLTLRQGIACVWDCLLYTSRMLTGRRSTISTITSGKWKKAVLRPDTRGIGMQSAL